MEHTDHDMRTLIEASARGDAESTRALYELLVEKVFAYVRSRTATKEYATDITQDVFIDLFSNLGNFTYRSRAQFFAYVFVITKRKLARHYELVKRRGVQAEFDEEHISPVVARVPLEREHDVARALETLDSETRDIVVLHHWSRYTFGEIALLIGMTESAVRVRHHRALEKLGTYLKDT